MTFYAAISTLLLAATKLSLLLYGRVYVNEFRLDDQILKCKLLRDEF